MSGPVPEVPGEPRLLIGELAERTNVSVRSLRYYEAQGLLAAPRDRRGRRRYPERAVDRVIRIQELFAAGLASARIREVLPCLRDADGGPSELATDRLVLALRSERDRIGRQVRDLRRAQDVLDSVLGTVTDDPPAPPSPPQDRAGSG